MGNRYVVVIIPTYNERENIKTLVESILDLHLNAHIVIVDDNSPDGTGEIADRLAQEHKEVEAIHRKRKLGLGTAYKTGFKKALKNGADVVMTMDADLSHNPKDIPKLLENIGKFDVVIGSRYVKGGKIVGFEIWRLLLSNGAQLFCQMLLGVKVHDSTSGFRAYKSEVIKAINPATIKSEGYSFLTEAIFRAQKKGFNIEEIPITFVARKKGKSKVSQTEIFKALVTVLRLRFRG